jgi:hypothetical protein
MGPLLECGYKGVLREVFGAGDVADEAGEAGDQARGFDSPDGVDGAVGVCDGHSPDHSIFVRLVQAWLVGAFRSSWKRKKGTPKEVCRSCRDCW